MGVAIMNFGKTSLLFLRKPVMLLAVLFACSRVLAQEVPDIPDVPVVPVVPVVPDIPPLPPYPNVPPLPDNVTLTQPAIVIPQANNGAPAEPITARSCDAQLINWHSQQAQYPTSDGNYYYIYNSYILVETSNGHYLLFADLGDPHPVIGKLDRSDGHACLLISRNNDGSYSIEQKAAAEISDDLTPGTSNSHWHRYPWSRALCETMRLCDN